MTIELAIKHESQLNDEYRDTLFDDKYKFYHVGGWTKYSIELEQSNWSNLQFVSIEDGNVIGYLGASIDRTNNSISCLQLLSFSKTLNINFTNDVISFFDLLFNKYNFNKINFSVVIDNPIHNSYCELVKRMNGTVVGVYKEHGCLIDGTKCDMKFFEVMKSDFIKMNERWYEYKLNKFLTEPIDFSDDIFDRDDLKKALSCL